MQKRILCVDDETNVLQAFERHLRKQFDIHTALGPEVGLQVIAEKGPFAVVVSDLRMPVMDGIAFLTRVRQISRDSVRVMLTGQADLTAAIAAVNQGNVFQFLTKPCPPDMLARALETALDQHRLITAERELLEQTLRGAVGVMSEILSLVNPPAFSRAQRIRRYVRHMASTLKLPDQWQYELAAMLSQIGCVTVPPHVLEKWSCAQPLNAEEREMLSSQCRIGHNLLAQIPRLEIVAAMVANQQAPSSECSRESDAAQIGAHLLKLALAFDEGISRGADVHAVLADLHRREEFNPEYLRGLAQVGLEQTRYQMRQVTVTQLQPGMVTGVDVFSKGGLLLLAKGQEITDSAIARLSNFAKTIGVSEPVGVNVSCPAASEQVEPTAIPVPASV